MDDGSWISWLLGVFSDLYELIVCAIKAWFCWALNLFIEKADEWFLTPVLEAIPDPPEGWDFSFLAGYWGLINLYLPATEMVALAAIYITAYVTVMAYRAIKAHVPGLA